MGAGSGGTGCHQMLALGNRRLFLLLGAFYIPAQETVTLLVSKPLRVAMSSPRLISNVSPTSALTFWCSD